MGKFINIGNTGVERARNGEYVDCKIETTVLV